MRVVEVQCRCGAGDKASGDVDLIQENASRIIEGLSVREGASARWKVSSLQGRERAGCYFSKGFIVR